MKRYRVKRRIVSYFIAKRLVDNPQGWDHWDGPWQSLAAARRQLKEVYSDATEFASGDFFIVKSSDEVLSEPRK